MKKKIIITIMGIGMLTGVLTGCSMPGETTITSTYSYNDDGNKVLEQDLYKDQNGEILYIVNY